MRGDKTDQDLGAPAEELVKLARQELGEMSTRRRLEGFVQLNARRALGRRRRRLAFRFAAVLAAVALVGIGYRSIAVRDSERLSYAVEGGQVDPNGVIEAQGEAQPTLRFSDGTEVVFAPGARGRVESVAQHGARIVMSGKVNVNVVHSQGAQWRFDAGPFLIAVTGTSFAAEWREADDRLEVSLVSGSVAVSGPLSDGAITLRAGQKLTISVREKEVVIREMGSPAAVSVTASSAQGSLAEAIETAPPPQQSEPLGAPVIEFDRPSASSTSSASALASGAPGPALLNWTSELAAGRYASILQQAEQRGLDKVISEVTSDQLAALSDAARYSRRQDVARRTLAGQRRRFPQSAHASDAAFLLGRLEETAGQPGLALEWYERYLAESPNGSYLSEALGRKMTVVQRLHGADRARPIAEQYLRRFSSGTYAAAARALIRAR